MLEFVRSLAEEAARLALDRSQSFRAELKADASWVTNVDREVERYLKSEILREYPDHAFYGEETGMEGSRDSQYVWFIDPIDGTTNFVKRIPAWCVSIGLLEQGEPVLGVIAVPPSGDLYWGTKGGGAMMNGVPLHAEDVRCVHAEDTIGISSDAIKKLDVSKLQGRIRNIGSAALDLAYVARGSLLGTVFLNEQAHDVAAGLCICAEAGCLARWLSDGHELKVPELLGRAVSDDHYIVSPPNAIEEIRQMLRKRST